MDKRPDTDPLRKTLARRYVAMLAPAAAILGAWAACRHLGLAPALPGPALAIMGPVVFILAIVLAVAAPILYRVNFVKKMKGRDHVDARTFLAFELNIMTLALAAPYVAAVGYICGVANFHFSGAFLASLYAAYYHFPSDKKLEAETRLFRVGGGEG